MPVCAVSAQTAPVINNVIIHLTNDLPILADVESLPSGPDRSITCTNIRTIDGKRPAFVHDQHSTFVFPLSVIRLIEARRESLEPRVEAGSPSDKQAPPPVEDFDQEPDEDLLAKIRSI